MDAVRALNAEVLDAYTGELLQQWLIKDHQIGCCYHTEQIFTVAVPTHRELDVECMLETRRAGRKH